VALVIGFFLLRGGTPINSAKVYADAVEDHADHCTLDKLDSFRVTVRDLNQLNELTVSNSKLAKMPDLSTFGYANPRAVMCTLNGKRLLHLIFQSDEQKPLSVFMGLHDKKIIEDDITTLTRGECKIASMSKDGTDLLVVSFLDEPQTATIAKAIAAQLQH
jgi:hypothetical protein